MTFIHRAIGKPRSVAVFAGAFNPPTAAHLALAQAALGVVDEVLLAIPRTFPHKAYHGASLEQRLTMLERIARSQPGLSAAVAEGGLFAEIAREARSHYAESHIHLLCGRDAAERILTWDYGDPGFVDAMLAEFELLVAPREGEFTADPRFQSRVRTLSLEGGFDDCSSTRVRDALQTGSDWRSLTPGQIVDLVESIYRQQPESPVWPY
jgi:nicotinate (nicotinamide) nucleotide adenylyltransferase